MTFFKMQSHIFYIIKQNIPSRHYYTTGLKACQVYSFKYFHQPCVIRAIFYIIKLTTPPSSCNAAVFACGSGSVNPRRHYSTSATVLPINIRALHCRRQFLRDVFKYGSRLWKILPRYPEDCAGFRHRRTPGQSTERPCQLPCIAPGTALRPAYPNCSHVRDVTCRKDAPLNPEKKSLNRSKNYWSRVADSVLFQSL